MLKVLRKVLIFSVLSVVLVGCQPRPQSEITVPEQPISESAPTVEPTPTAVIESEIPEENLPNIPAEKPVTETEQQEAEEPTVEDTSDEEVEQEQAEAETGQETQSEPEEKTEEQPEPE